MQLDNLHILIVIIPIKNKDKFLKSINHFLNKKMIAVTNIKKKTKIFMLVFQQKKEFINM